MKLKSYLSLAFVVVISLQVFEQNNIDLLILNKNYKGALQEIDRQIEVQQIFILRKGWFSVACKIIRRH